jgi:hypothetical protein
MALVFSFVLVFPLCLCVSVVKDRIENSVIRSFHEPGAAEQVVHEAVERDGFSVL